MFCYRFWTWVVHDWFFRQDLVVWHTHAILNPFILLQIPVASLWLMLPFFKQMELQQSNKTGMEKSPKKAGVSFPNHEWQHLLVGISNMFIQRKIDTRCPGRWSNLTCAYVSNGWTKPPCRSPRVPIRGALLVGRHWSMRIWSWQLPLWVYWYLERVRILFV